MSMIEKVAVALWVARGDYPKTATEVALIWPALKDGLMKQARSVIEAMREPTKEMGLIAWGELGDSSEPERVWRIMIDAALRSNGQ